MDGEGGGAPLRLRDQRGLSVLLQWYPACPGKRRFELKLAPATSVSSNPVTKPLWGTGQQKLWGGQLPAQPGLPPPPPGRSLLASPGFWVCPSLTQTCPSLKAHGDQCLSLLSCPSPHPQARIGLWARGTEMGKEAPDRAQAISDKARLHLKEALLLPSHSPAQAVG